MEDVDQVLCIPEVIYVIQYKTNLGLYFVIHWHPILDREKYLCVQPTQMYSYLKINARIPHKEFFAIFEIQCLLDVRS